VNISTSKALLVWWFTNKRAGAVLAARAVELGIKVVIVAGESDKSLGPFLRENCLILLRELEAFDEKKFELLLDEMKYLLGVEQIMIAPTSEYLQHKISQSTSFTQQLFSPMSNVNYKLLSSKSWSTNFVSDFSEIETPRELTHKGLTPPFVLKPIENVHGENTLKPLLINHQKILEKATALPNFEFFFPQEYVPPPSFYWCGYRSKNGEISFYWQQNIVQQSHGGSMVLAKLKEPRNAEHLAKQIELLLVRLEYVGPLMVEFRGPKLTFIEWNPRFWGPLLLSQARGLNVVDSFLSDWFGPFQEKVKNSCFNFDLGDYYVPSLLVESSIVVNLLADTELSVKANKIEAPIPEEYFNIIKKIGGDW
jgi:hypothetical protein